MNPDKAETLTDAALDARKDYIEAKKCQDIAEDNIDEIKQTDPETLENKENEQKG